MLIEMSLRRMLMRMCSVSRNEVLEYVIENVFYF
jgi:hypothetical protein